MRRLWTNLVITGYLSTLCYGFTIHLLNVDTFNFVGNYFVVWDMYCGWSAFESRGLLIAEGESGQLYDVSPPWKELKPFGSAERHHYDSWGIYSGSVAANTLKHTQHEPIINIMLVEQLWSKKYNLPDHLWEKRFDEAKEPRIYYYIRSVFDGEGTLTTRHYDWRSNLNYYAVIDNPALRSTVARSQPYIVSDPLKRPRKSFIEQASFEVRESSKR